MEIGFFFWPFTPPLVRRVATAADRFDYDMVGIADTPGNAMDPWIAATMVAQAASRTRVALCVTNLVSRHPAIPASAIASLELLAPGRAVLGIGAGHSGTRNLGAILAFMAGGYIFKTSHFASRGVPENLREPMQELRRRYSTRPGEADARLVDELGLFDYLAKRFAIYGTPGQCLEQLLTARDAGLKRVMFTVSLASNPARTVELFGERVLPELRG